MRDIAVTKHLEWMRRKLASKEASYPFHRLSYSLRRRWVDRRFPTRVQRRRACFDFSRLESDNADMVEHFQRRFTPRWHFELSGIEEIVTRIPAETKDRTVREAERITNYRFSVCGYAPLRLDPMKWDYAPDGFLAWTAKLNRHDCFEVLGFAYHYTSDECFARTFVELSNSWIDQVAGRIGKLEWDRPFNVARRLSSWIWSFFLFLGSPSWERADQRRFISILGLLTEYLYGAIEYHSPGNHILLEAKVLALCGEVFPEFAGAQEWRTEAWRILSREMELQVCEDGVHAERATMYHRAIAGELAELWLFCSKNNLPQTRSLEQIVQRMALFQRWIDLGSGRYPLLGDSLAGDTYYRFSAPVIVAARSGMQLPLEDGVSDHTWWVLNVAHGARHGSDQEGVKAFPKGGYYVSRSRTASGTNVLVWDCGPLGYHANRKHGHADALSIVLSVEGEPLLIDPGQGGPSQAGFSLHSRKMIDLVESWSELRTTRAHNTISIDGQDQAVLGQRSEIWNPPNPEVILWGSSHAHDVMWGRHNGYRRLREPAIHERLIIANHDGYWLVVDRLSGNGVHTADLRYHIAPCASLERTGPNQFRIRKLHADLLLTVFGPQIGNTGLVLEEGETTGELRGGHPELIPVVCGSYTGIVPFVLGTFLAISRYAWEMRLIEVNELRCVIEIVNERKSDELVVQFGGADLDPRIEIIRHDVNEGFVRNWTFEQNRSIVGS